MVCSFIYTIIDAKELFAEHMFVFSKSIKSILCPIHSLKCIYVYNLIELAFRAYTNFRHNLWKRLYKHFVSEMISFKFRSSLSKSLQIWNSVCFLWSVVCSASAVYVSLCRGLKYLLKVRHIIRNYPNVARFFIFETLCLGRAKTLTYVWK